MNNLQPHGRWAFTKFTEVDEIEAGLEAGGRAEFDKMIGLTTAS